MCGEDLVINLNEKSKSGEGLLNLYDLRETKKKILYVKQLEGFFRLIICLFNLHIWFDQFN